jgi:hypothetical protein
MGIGPAWIGQVHHPCWLRAAASRAQSAVRSPVSGMCGRPAVITEPVSSMPSRSKYHLTLTVRPASGLVRSLPSMAAAPALLRVVDAGTAST